MAKTIALVQLDEDLAVDGYTLEVESVWQGDRQVAVLMRSVDVLVDMRRLAQGAAALADERRLHPPTDDEITAWAVRLAAEAAEFTD